MNSQKQLFILCFVIVAAVSFHGTALYFLHGATIHFSSMGSSGFIENHMDIHEMAPPLAENEEPERKNEMLANLFKNLQHQKIAEKNPEIYEAKPEFTEVALLATPSPHQSEIWEEPSFEFKDDIMLAQPQSFSQQDLAMEELIPSFDAELHLPESLEIPMDVVREANLQIGSIEVDHPELADALKGIKIGQESVNEYPFNDEALFHSSGLRNIGSDDPIIGTLPIITDKPDVRCISQEAHINHPLLCDMPVHMEGSQAVDFSFLPELNNVADSSGLPDIAKVAASNDFSLEVEYAPTADGAYLFSIKFLPKRGISFKRIRQNIFFLIDRSHSINKERYEATKQAVLKSLEMLHPKDTFNILIFDDKVVRLSSQNLPWSDESRYRAQTFLANQEYQSFFASTDLYTSLGDIIPEGVANTEVNTVILLSDGDTYLNKDSQRKSIAKWTGQNSGKVSLFSIAAGKGNNLPLLDLLSSFNKGSLQFTPSVKEIDKTLVTLLAKIRNPIGKDISATVISDSNMNVTLYPTPNRAPDLYEQIPYVIYGKAANLNDFHIFLQGRYYDKSLDIKQLVSFNQAKKVSRKSLEKIWALQQAYDAYDNYLKDGKSGHLLQAQRWLSPFKIPLAFQ